MSRERTKIFVEAIPLVAERPSGISYAVLGLVSALANDPALQERYEVVLVAPKRGLHLLDRWPSLQGCTRKGLPLRMRIIQGLMRVHMLPPMDLLLGRGVYLFGNFMNWKVTKRSVSLTYIHDIAFALFPHFVSPKLQRMLMAKVPGFIAQTDYVITVSESSKQEIVEHFAVPDTKVLVLYNGVDAATYRPYGQTEVRRVKAKYDITKPYFLFVSSIEPRKNVQRLVEAFAALPEGYSLVIVGGSGWLNEDTLATIERLRQQGVSIIKPSQYVPNDEVSILMSGAVALVHPAFHEGFGMPPAEAMACGVPAIVSDIPSLREVTGDAGIYCDPQDTGSITAAMRQVLSLSPAERTSITKKGIIRAKQFSWEKSAVMLGDFLDTKVKSEGIRDGGTQGL
ncbi:MAG TPA: glycosyltransferase family 1 protein [Candidatus Saccharimonadales bacterium]|nr:glycosyltransferase family 1 protein [Candidatus Saccharimonadales bacterium]